jgi:hypothetical protein
MFARALATAALLAASIASAQVAATGAPKGDSLPLYRLRLLGVYDSETSEAVSSAEVTDLKSGASGTTNRSGLVSLHFLPVGGALVRIRKVGYTPVTLFVTISPTDTAPLTEVLTRSVRTLPVVTTRDSTVKWVSPGLRGFEERRHAGFGHFITDAELRKADDEAFKNVVARFPALQVSCEPVSLTRGVARRSGCYAITTRMTGRLVLTPGKCYVTIYLDGVQVQGADETDLEKMKTQDYGGVEFYSGASEIPPEYNATGNSCGVLLLWTRER